ncbi:uncharacterized protein LOC126322614 [Schistocerca gregaria]|uniref:uncharacterized protein LOC126322614 n=1 Tax=Schistocerca gregaria TaxID=7010 RepID=UPI00211F0B10|nr:uncharacterized protein LOC126322614 [Schistocerca gregaria]
MFCTSSKLSSIPVHRHIATRKNAAWEFYQLSSLTILATLPVGLVIPSSFLSLPLNLVLGFAIPVHTFYNMHHVIEDYVPSAYVRLCNILLWVACVLTFIGLLKLNLYGDGILDTIKSFWKKEERK